VTLPGDAQTWSVTIYISSRDRALKQLRDPCRWTAVVAACPLRAHLLGGEPITGVLAMGGPVNRYRRLVAGGTQVVTEIVSMGDSWSCTNPSLGRGITTGLMHAVGTAEVVREYLGDPLPLARRHDEMSEAGVRPGTGTRSSLTGRGRSRSTRPSTLARPGLRADPAVLLRGVLTVAMMETLTCSGP
jgi:hypothetical protein